MQSTKRSANAPLEEQGASEPRDEPRDEAPPARAKNPMRMAVLVFGLPIAAMVILAVLMQTCE